MIALSIKPISITYCLLILAYTSAIFSAEKETTQKTYDAWKIITRLKHGPGIDRLEVLHDNSIITASTHIKPDWDIEGYYPQDITCLFNYWRYQENRHTKYSTQEAHHLKWCNIFLDNHRLINYPDKTSTRHTSAPLAIALCKNILFKNHANPHEPGIILAYNKEKTLKVEATEGDEYITVSALNGAFPAQNQQRCTPCCSIQ